MTESVDRLAAALENRYAIESELGSGGMATVYLAEDLKHKRKVAVKVLRPDTVSPDGRWLAYASAEDGALRGYLRTWPDMGRRTLVTGTDTLSPSPPMLHWSADARTLYYERSNDDVVAITIGTDGTASRPRVLFNVRGGRIVSIDHPRNRFLVRQSAVGADDPDALPEPNRIVVITNWFAELERRLGESR